MAKTNIEEEDNIVGNPSQAQVKIEIQGDVTESIVIAAGGDVYFNHHRPIGIPFQVPMLPPHFVRRPEVTDVLKARLLADSPSTPGVLVVSAIHGLGGIGKSTLAAALGYDREVQQRFKDGILWATLGQQPDLLSLLSGWVQALGDYEFRPTTVEAATTHLRSLLHDKAMLLIVDDAWEPEHAQPFRVGGPHGQVLITTRRADVADEVGAELQQLDVMTPDQSLALLMARLGRPLAEIEQSEALALAKELGYLPLALELAAVRVTRDSSWTALREALVVEIARLEALEGPRKRRERPRLEASFNLSLNALRADDEQAWQAFIWLGVLPEDVRLAAPMAATLWDISEAAAAEMLELLWNDALLLPGPPVWIGQREWRTYRLHDLLHDMARRLLTSTPPQGLSLTLPAAHASLLDCYRSQTQNGLWHTLADDGYIHSHLAWHLEQAGRGEELHTLLAEETATGQNGWYEVQDRLGQTAAYLKDVVRAWRLAEILTDDIGAGGRGKEIGWQCRYGLITASLNSQAKNISPELLVRLVEKGLWSATRGLAYARQMPESDQRAVALARLVPYLPESERKAALHQALAASEQIWYKEVRARVLAGLVPHLPEPERELVLGPALVAARQIENEEYRAEALARLAPHLPEPLLRQALAAAGEMQVFQVRALTELAPRLAELGYPDQALEAAGQIESEDCRAWVLARLVPHLPEPDREAALRQTLAAAGQIRNAKDRAWVLARWARYKPAVRLLILAATGQSEVEWKWNPKALAGLVPHLAELGYPDQALEIAGHIQDKRFRAEALAELALHLPEPEREAMLRQALVAAEQIQYNHVRAEALARLAPHLPEPERKVALHQALAAIRLFYDKKDQAEMLARLVPQLPEPETALREALAAAGQIWDEPDRAEALAGLAPHLPESLLRQALEAAEQVRDEMNRAWILAGLAPHLPEPLLRQALEAAEQVRDEMNRARILAGMISRLAELGYPDHALEVTKQIQAEVYRAEALVRLVPHLPEPEREATLRQALKVTGQIRDESDQVKAIAWLVPHLPEPERETTLRQALKTAGQIENESFRAEALAKLAPHLPEPLLRQAVVDIGIPLYGFFWGQALAGLCSRLAELGYPDQALTIACQAWPESSRAEALAKLAPHLPEPLLHQALASARQIVSQYDHADALAGLVPRLAELGHIALSLEVTGQIEIKWNRAEALAGLAPHLAALPCSTLYSLWRKTLPVLSTRTRRDLLSDLRALTPLIFALGGETAITETFRAIQDVDRWWP
jgi:hypothetical protein